MAEFDKDGDLPGSDGADLGGLGEDVLSADLEADLVADLGDDALDEGDPDDAGDPAGDGEFEDSGDDSADDGDGGLGGGAFSGGFGGDALFEGLEFGGSGDDSFDFGDGADGGFTPAAGPVGVVGTAGAGSSAGGRGSDHGAAAASGKPSFTASGGHKDKAGRGDHDGESGAFAKASPSDFVSEPHRRSDGKKGVDDGRMTFLDALVEVPLDGKLPGAPTTNFHIHQFAVADLLGDRLVCLGVGVDQMCAFAVVQRHGPGHAEIVVADEHPASRGQDPGAAPRRARGLWPARRNLEHGGRPGRGPCPNHRDGGQPCPARTRPNVARPAAAPRAH